MAGFLEQIPKLLVARRKAAAAAQANPAATAAFWMVLRTIANHYRNHVREAVVAGCTFPDRPIALSPADAGLLNFGMIPNQFRHELAWKAADAAGRPPPPVAHPPLTPEDQRLLRERLTRVANSHGLDHRQTRVYNLEPWLQEIYRDRLDIDYAEELQRRIASCERDMESAPRGLQAAGLPPALAAEVMDAFNKFRAITHSAHMLEREKQSFVDRRQFALVATQIETALARAAGHLGSSGARNPVHELFTFWKNANFETMKLTRALREVWAGTRLDERIQELSGCLAAVLAAAARAGDDAAPPRPSCPLLSADEAGAALPYAAAADALALVADLDDATGTADPSSVVGELRRYGPLSVLLVPGSGRARYAAELRQALVKVDEDGRRDATAPTERDLDIERRLRYPLNVIVLPLLTPGEELVPALAEAWLEWKAIARPKPLKDALDELRRSVPAMFEWPADQGPAPPNHARRTLARHLAAFGVWMRTGAAPDPGTLPSYAAFAEWVKARLPAPELLAPLRYRAAVEAFRSFSPKRRKDAWRRYLGPRRDFDHQALALELIRRDWHAFAGALQRLDQETRRNPLAERALAESRGADPLGDRDRRVEAGLRKFMESDPELKAALVTMETRVAIELDVQRAQGESLGKRFHYDQVIGDVLPRLSTQLAAGRRACESRLDRYLVGLLYAVDDNLPAAISALVDCLTRAGRVPEPPAPWRDAGEEWFEERFPAKTGNFEKRPVPGEEGLGGEDCVDYIYFNLGRLYRRLGRSYEALLCFYEFAGQADARGWHYHGLLARAEYEALRSGLAVAPGA